MNAAFLSQLNDLLNRTGRSTDPAGISTLFARLNQIAGYTDTLETLLGLTSDVANGSGDIMARLAQLILYTDTLETGQANIKAKTDLIGAAADAAGAATVFARLAQIAGYTDNIEPLLGTNADAPATNASMWAMLKTLNAKSSGTDLFALTPNIQKYSNASSLSIAALASLDLITINGKGIVNLAEVFVSPSDTAMANIGLVLVLDGIEYITYFADGANTVISPLSTGTALATTTGASSIQRIPGNFKFNSSCILRVKNISGTQAFITASPHNNQLVGRLIANME